MASPVLEADAMLALVPAGLDGNSKPLVTAERTRLLRVVASKVTKREGSGTVLVGIDGASGTGKSTFGDELADVLGLSRDLPFDPGERAAEVERRRTRARRERYVESQAMYEREASPGERADLVIDNDDLAAPTIVVDRL